jgi:hypothetical protein
MQMICTGVRGCGLEQIVGVNIRSIYQPCMRLPGAGSDVTSLPRPWPVSPCFTPTHQLHCKWIKWESLWPWLAYLAYGKHSNHLGWKDMAASRTLRTISFEVQEMPGVELLHHLQKRAERWTNDWSRSRSKPIRFFLWCSQCFFCIVIVLSVAVACVWLCFYKTISEVTITSGSTTVTHNLVVDQEVQLKGAMSQPHLTSLWSLRAVCCKMCAETIHGCKKCTNQFLMLNIVINTSAVCTLQSPA